MGHKSNGKQFDEFVRLGATVRARQIKREIADLKTKSRRAGDRTRLEEELASLQAAFPTLARATAASRNGHDRLTMVR